MASSIAEGGYDFEFLTDLPEDLTCVLCHFAFKNPVQVEECGHVFCKQCFDNMKNHAESICVELLCPLDRQHVDVTRVFKDKRDERRVLNLMVKCQNFGDKCDWTGELREALEHKTKCCKDETMLNNLLESELKQLINRLTELEVNSKAHERKLLEKDEQIVNLNKHIENQEKQIGYLNNHNANQDKQIAEQKKQIKNLQKSPTNSINQQPILSSPLSMIIPNIEDESNYAPICTAFQWKFNPFDVKSGTKISPPFYSVMNAYCFRLEVEFKNNNFCISLRRYRGKYDDNVKEVKTSKDFDFQIHIFGKNSKLKILEYVNDSDYTISEHNFKSGGYWEQINNGEIGSLTVDGYVHLHCFFNKVDD